MTRKTVTNSTRNHSSELEEKYSQAVRKDKYNKTAAIENICFIFCQLSYGVHLSGTLRYLSPQSCKYSIIEDTEAVILCCSSAKRNLVTFFKLANGEFKTLQNLAVTNKNLQGTSYCDISQRCCCQETPFLVITLAELLTLCRTFQDFRCFF